MNEGRDYHGGRGGGLWPPEERGGVLAQSGEERDRGGWESFAASLRES